MTKPGFAILAPPSDGKLIEQILCDSNHPCALIEPDELVGLVRRGEIGVLFVAEVVLDRFDHVELRPAIAAQPTWSHLNIPLFVERGDFPRYSSPLQKQCQVVTRE